MSAIEPGRVLAGKYRVERVLGTGGMGVVVAATHMSLDERVAIKLLLREHLERPGAAERVVREARAARKIDSDHVVRVFDVGTLEDGTPFIVMELLLGCDLAQLLCAEGRFSVQDATSYVVEACDALAKAHALGIVHRDLKPANLFLATRADDTTCIKVLDFGISKFPAVDSALTSTTALLGSPVYMSPEQLESTRDVDARSDVWSLGVILYELLTGSHPFVAETLPQLCRKIGEAQAPSVKQARADVPDAVADAVARCLAKKPGDRFHDVTSLAAALAPFARSTVETARSGERMKAPATSSRLGWPARAAVLVGGLALAAFAWRSNVKAKGDHEARGPVVSPLAAPGSVLACPSFASSGVEEPSGWLGAAAASLACVRAQARMGGRSERTLFAAELLDAPRTPVDGFPEDPFGALDQRERVLGAARARAPAYLDGAVTRGKDDFKVDLVLRASADGCEAARGSGHGAILLDAVRGAMAPLEASGAIPSAPDDDPFLREWYRARTAAGAVATLDANLLAAMEWRALEDECARLVARGDLLAEGKRVAAARCAEYLGSPPETSHARDRSSPGALVASLEADRDVEHAPLDSDLAALEAALAQVTTKQERAHILTEEARVVLEHGDGARATALALRAAEEDPKAYGAGGTAWGILSWVRATSNAAPGAIAWQPWAVEAYCFNATRSDSVDLKLRYARRDAVLSHAKIWNANLVEFLLLAGRRDEARSVAAGVQWEGVDVLVDAADARFGKAIARARAALASRSAFEAFYTSSSANYVFLVLDRRPDQVDAVVARYIAPEPSPIKGELLTTYMATLTCALAPREVARPCFARIRAVTPGPVAWVDGLLEGAERFAERDWQGAARAWRTMLAHPGWQLDQMRDYLAIAFEHAGEDDLMEKVDAPTLAAPGRYNGAELAHVRAARLAERRGDKDRAREMARRVIDAWSVADVEVPAVDEMRRLVARLK
jgi:tRNA A-37 threonylcarbamoyl transferase component Bud32